MFEAPTPERHERVLSERIAGEGRSVYVAGVLALTEPGPAAAGMVVTDEKGRSLARRSQYLGPASRREATIRALLIAAQYAPTAGLRGPRFLLDDAELVKAIRENREDFEFAASVHEALRNLPGSAVEHVSAGANLARPVALAPLVEWLPERTRRSEQLRVQRLREDTYEVESESQPGLVYRVALRTDNRGEGDLVECECADFQYRGIPCKHLLAVAREAGTLEHLFYAEPHRPSPRSEAA